MFAVKKMDILDRICSRKKWRRESAICQFKMVAKKEEEEEEEVEEEKEEEKEGKNKVGEEV